MQTAVASPPTLILPPSIGTAAESVADPASAGDFAALLLGQLLTEVAPELLPEDTATTVETGEAMDPAAILAAMGLTLETPPPRQAALPTQGEGIDDGAAIVGQHALQQRTGGLMQTGIEMSSSLATEAATMPTDVTAQTAPANFAGFEKKLAESLTAGTDLSPQHISGHAAATPSASAGNGEQLKMSTPLREPAWPAEFSQKVVWMATQEKQNAQLTLNPPQMGPIEISLSVKNEQASAMFVSANPEVREAIEAALPRLREMLANVGVELGQTNVGAESFRQAQDNNREAPRGSGAWGETKEEGSAGPTRIAGNGIARRGNGLVDTFA